MVPLAFQTTPDIKTIQNFNLVDTFELALRYFERLLNCSKMEIIAWNFTQLSNETSQPIKFCSYET